MSLFICSRCRVEEEKPNVQFRVNTLPLVGWCFDERAYEAICDKCIVRLNIVIDDETGQICRGTNSAAG